MGRLGVAICLDAFKDDVLDRLEAEGADILVQPSANPAPWTPDQQADWLNGAWRAVAGRGRTDGGPAWRFSYAVNPMMVGEVLNLGFYGQSAILARATPSPGEARGAGARPPAGNAASPRGEASLGYAAKGPRPGFLAVAPAPDEEAVLVVTVPHPRGTGDGQRPR